MKVSKRMVYSLILLIVSSIFCVCVGFAWFSSNLNVRTGGMNTSVGVADIQFEVRAYKINREGIQNFTYTIGDEITAGNNIDKYDRISYCGVLIELSYTFKNDGNYKIFIKNGGDDITVADISENKDGSLFKGNLSHAIAFNGNIELNGDKLTFGKNYQALSFIKSDNGQYIASGEEITVGTVTGSGKTYLVMDYESSYVENLYTLSLKEGGGLNTAFTFVDDLIFCIDTAAQRLKSA